MQLWDQVEISKGIAGCFIHLAAQVAGFVLCEHLEMLHCSIKDLLLEELDVRKSLIL
jgi:hypothetical protein